MKQQEITVSSSVRRNNDLASAYARRLEAYYDALVANPSQYESEIAAAQWLESYARNCSSEIGVQHFIMNSEDFDPCFKQI